MFKTVCVLAILFVSAQSRDVIVKAPAGNWRGVTDYIEGKEVHSFKGIQYGEAPVGDLRFQRPLPAADFDARVQDAKEWGNACIHSIDPFKITKEDCLYLNVWVPQTNKGPLPVMYWIYGGGFIFGSANDIYDGRVMAAFGDVIVVTVNYRIGVLGFLYGGENEPGNQGLYDQILGLKWVQRNIAAFGGDPNKVTIFGESAGSMSVTGLILSPLAKGLFKRAISQSGSLNGALTKNVDWGLTEMERHAQTLGCEKPTNEEMVKCLKTVPEWRLGLLGAIPGNARPVWGSELLPLNPNEALKYGNFNADVDYLFGVNNDEGSLILPLVLNVNGGQDYLPGLPPLTLTLAKAKSDIAYILKFILPNLDDKFISKIGDYYTKGLNDDNKEELRLAVSAAISDFVIICPTIVFGEAVGAAAAKKGRNAYSYRLTYGTHALTQLGSFCGGWMGVCHAEDLPFVFGWPFSGSPVSFVFNDDDKRLSRDVIKAWTDFAKTGKIDAIEGQKWDKALKNGDSAVTYMELNPNNFRMVPNKYKKTCDELIQPYFN